MRTHTIQVSERELRAILSAFDIARDETINAYAHWWRRTQYVNALYERLKNHGL